MNKWLLVISVLLLVASLAGDVFFVHHHLSSFSVESEHVPPQHSVSYLNNLVGGLSTSGLPLGYPSYWSSGGADGVLGYFCGWHNSAYLEGMAFPD